MHSLAALAGPAEQSNAQTLVGWPSKAALRSPFEVWLQNLSRESLALMGQPGPDTAQQLLILEAAELNRSIPEHLVATVVGLATSHGWDPNRRLTWEEVSRWKSRSRESRVNDETFLEWLLYRDPQYYEHSVTSLAPGLCWPVTLEAFLAFDALHTPRRNQEWFIALTVASGANPWSVAWSENDDKGLDRKFLAFNRALRDHPSIAVQLLGLPGAPTATEAFHHKDSVAFHWLEMWEREFSSEPEKGLKQLAFLMDSLPGLRLSDKMLVHMPLSALVDYVKAGSMDEQTSLRIDARAQERNGIGVQIRFRALLPTNQWSLEEQGRLEQIARVNHYLEYAFLDRSGFMDIPRRRRPLAWLTTPLDTQEQGRWSFLSALATLFVVEGMRDINLPFAVGCPKLWWNTWLGSDLPPSSLAPLLDETLGKGLDARGVWALAILGQTAQREGQQLSTVVKRDQESVLFGVDDWQAFSEQSLESALRATEWLLAQGVSSDGLCEAWQQWVTGFEWPTNRLDRLVHLLTLLGQGRAATWETPEKMISSWRSRWGAFLTRVGTIFPWSESTPLHLASEAHLPLSFELRLAHHHPDRVAEIVAWFKHAKPPAWAVNRLGQWLESVSDMEAEDVGSYLLEEADFVALKDAWLHRSLQDSHGDPSMVERSRF